MAAERESSSVSDYVVTAISPALIMLMVGSLVFFLVEVLYAGKYSSRLLYILFFFVSAAVLVARISIQLDAGRATAYGVALGIATYLALLTYVEYPDGWLKSWGWLVNLGLMAAPSGGARTNSPGTARTSTRSANRAGGVYFPLPGWTPMKRRTPRTRSGVPAAPKPGAEPKKKKKAKKGKHDSRLVGLDREVQSAPRGAAQGRPHAGRVGAVFRARRAAAVRARSVAGGPRR